MIALEWLGEPAEGWESTWCGMKCSLELERAVMGTAVLDAALLHVLLEPDDSGSFSLHMCWYIYIHTHIYKAPSGAQSPV